MSKTINIRARTGITALPVYDRITVTDSNAYHLIIEMADLESIPGQVILRFVRPDDVTLEQIVDPANVIDNRVYHTLSEQQTEVAGALQMYVRITDGVSELYTAALIIFTDVVPLAGGDTTPTEDDVSLVASIAAAEASRVTAESARAIAEDLREQAETDRLLAENGRYDAEYARYLAETSRAEAEDARAYWADFDPLRQYSAGEKAYYLGSSYICTAVPPIGTLPTETGYWSIVVQKGDVQYATFDVDENGELFMTTTPDYAGPTFSLTEAGNLEVSI